MDFELEVDAVGAVGELDDEAGVRNLLRRELTPRGVFDVRDDVGASMKAGKIEEVALVDGA